MQFVQNLLIGWNENKRSYLDIEERNTYRLGDGVELGERVLGVPNL